MAIIDGKTHAAAIRNAVRLSGIPCKLAVVLVGDDPASLVYINMKKKACEEVGFDFQLFNLPADSDMEAVAKLLKKLNKAKNITGILVQQPLPAHLDKNEVVSLIDPNKDVDCLHPVNVGKVVAGHGLLKPCTPAGIITLLKREDITIRGKNAVVVGRSEIVGKPLAAMLLAEDATVTVCHSKTEGLEDICRQADILCVAIGRANFITADMVKPAAVIIDVGVNRNNKKLCGDVDFEQCQRIASYITPVPGGVGPMTVATLMENCLRAWSLQNG